MLNAVLDPILSLVFPQQCNSCRSRECSSRDGVACAECWERTRLFTGVEMLCAKCGAYFNPTTAGHEVRCHKCDEHAYDLAFAAGIYEHALSANLLELKRSPSLCRRVNGAIIDAIGRADVGDVDLIMPVPLSKRRRFERGFNQAEVLAKVVADALGVASDAYTLARKAHTPIHRVGMDDKARELTVKNAFEITRPRLIAGKNVLLVDDIFTSGATTSACARVLKKNGAGKVIVFTAARAVMT